MAEAVDILLELQRHSSWANRQILAVAERMPPEQLRTPVGEGGYGDLLETLLHMYDAQKSWLDRASTGVSGPIVNVDDVQDVATLRALWDELDVEMENYLMSLDDASLTAPVSYRSFYGSEGVYSHRDMMLHQTMHSHQHRGEVALVLTQLGYSPGEIDVIDYLLSQSEPSE